MLSDQTEADAVEEPSKLKNESGRKIFFGVLGGCLTAFLIVSLIIAGLIWWATPKVKEGIEKNKPKFEEWAKEMEKQAREAEEQKAREQNENSEPAASNTQETNQPSVTE